MGWAEYGEPVDLSTVQQFAGDQACLDGFADPDVVGDQDAHRVELEGHYERDKLVGTGLHGDLGERAERTCAGAEAELDGISQKTGGTVVAPPRWVGHLEGGRLHGL